ncbi:hypothetical protein T492DRAFT_875914 [Pavlovales sp. CCMP2436]|nr:hypothetical protein T492DRAFT_875914 [Pavlovales sp. CCMP2436]
MWLKFGPCLSNEGKVRFVQELCRALRLAKGKDYAPCIVWACVRDMKLMDAHSRLLEEDPFLPSRISISDGAYDKLEAPLAERAAIVKGMATSVNDFNKRFKLKHCCVPTKHVEHMPWWGDVNLGSLVSHVRAGTMLCGPEATERRAFLNALGFVWNAIDEAYVVVVVVDMLARAKPPARLSSPDARSTPPRSLERRTETAEANHLQFLLAKKGRAEEIGSRRVDAALSKRSEKEVAAMRALAAMMASSDELLNTSRKIQMLKFEKARFLRQAARNARAKLDEALADANAHAKLKVEHASPKHSQLLAGVAHTNALKIARAKEISAKTKAMLSLEAAEQALLAKMAAATAAQAVAESKHNEAIASKVAKAASTVERAASQAKNAAEQAELSRARIVHAMFVRLQAAEYKRAALLATPTKQSRARAHAFVNEPKRAISDALESRLLRPADADDVARARNLATAAERTVSNCSRAIGTKAALLQKLAAAHARVPAAQAQRATAAAALAAGLAAGAAAADARLAARAAGRSVKAAAATARRAATAQRVLERRSAELANAAEAADKVLSASGRAAAAVCSVRTQAFRTAARAALAACRRVALKVHHAARASSEAVKALEAATARAEHLKATTERAGAFAARLAPSAPSAGSASESEQADADVSWPVPK